MARLSFWAVEVTRTNIGNVSDHVAQVHTALNESEQDVGKSRLMLYEISVSSGSGRYLAFELNVEHLRTLPTAWNVLVAFAKSTMLFESQTCCRMGTGGPDGP